MSKQRILNDWNRSVVIPSKIGVQVGSEVRLRGPGTYRDAFKTAKRMKEEKKSDQYIREQLQYKMHLLEESAEDGPQMSIHKQAQNQAERILADFYRKGVETAIAGKTAKVPDTSLYGDSD